MPKETTDVMETVNFTDILKKRVYAEDPVKLVELVNKLPNERLDPRNDYHLDVAQEKVLMFIKWN